MITYKDFGVADHWCFTLPRLYKVAGGEAEAWDLYFDPEGMDESVRHFFENSVHPAARPVAVMIRAAIKRMERNRA